MRVYDLETYPNIFTYGDIGLDTDDEFYFELSDWRDDWQPLCEYLHSLRVRGVRMIGYNNEFFDYTHIHAILTAHYRGEKLTSQYLCDLSGHIIRENNNGLWPSDQMIPQIDLYKINHFDNKAKRTSLKQLEFAMKSRSVQDLPFPPGTVLTADEAVKLRTYHRHDIHQTRQFALKNRDAIEFRDAMTERTGINVTNFNDTKIGKQYLIQQLGDHLCYTRETGRRQPRQTIYNTLNLGEVIFPYVQPEHPELRRVVEYFRAKTLSRFDMDEMMQLADPNTPLRTKGVFSDLTATVDGFTFVFGVGGIHGSIERAIVEASDTHAIIDLDVTGYYSSLNIANRIFPAHLSSRWCDEHINMKVERAKYPKKTHPKENKLYKLALNGSYGDTGSVWSPFYDAKYMLSITINGQLLLCMLAEQLMKIPGLRMIQANTDGVTVACPRVYLDALQRVTDWWQAFTCLELERAEYRRMFIRDVNNYLAEPLSGDVKRKGAYQYELEWHQNHSMLVIPKAVEAFLLRGVPLMHTLETHPDDHDFCAFVKTPRTNRLEFGGVQMQNATRYYVAIGGAPLKQIGPPPAGYRVGQWKRANGIPDSFYQQVLNELRTITPAQGAALDTTGLPWDERINTKSKGVFKNRVVEVESGRTVMVCNEMEFFSRDLLDYSYYLAECQKLIQLQRQTFC